jgi:hypothetical protein
MVDKMQRELNYEEASKYYVKQTDWANDTFAPFVKMVRKNGDTKSPVLRDCLGRVLIWDSNHFNIIGWYDGIRIIRYYL